MKKDNWELSGLIVRKITPYDQDGSLDEAALKKFTGWLIDEGVDHLFPDSGRIHWVAVVPEEQGKGLAKVPVSQTCQRMQTLRYKKSFLSTFSNKLPAIKIYQNFSSSLTTFP